MKISKRLKFLIPYLNKDVGKLVNLKKLKAIKTYTIPLNKFDDSDGAIIRYDTNHYVITLRITKNNYLNQTQSLEYLYNILEALAHEISHLKHWNHTPDHYVLTNKIGTLFGKMLKKQGVKDTYMKINKVKYE